MKSTYKLFGIYWDGMKALDSSALSIEALHTDRIHNGVSLNKLLCVEKQEDLEELINPINNDEEIIIEMDYYVTSDNKIIHSFIEKRLCQIVYRLSEYFKRVRCVKNPSDATNN